MDDRFFHALVGAEVQVCGAHLHSLSPWHVLLLHALESPLVTGDGVVTAADVQVMLKVAKCHYPATPSFEPSFSAVYWRLRLRNSKTLLRETRKLQRWLDVQMSVPRLYEVTHSTNSVKRGLSSPSVFALVAALASKLGDSLASVWNMRLAEARWLDTTLAELNGAELTISYENEEEPPDPEQEMTEDEIVALAKSTLRPAIFKSWLKQRKRK